MDPTRSIIIVFAVLALFAISTLGQGVGSKCTETGPSCSPGLTCKNETCECDFTWQFYDGKLSQCVSPVGGFCKGDESLKCTPNSVCSSKDTALQDYLGFCFCSAPFDTMTGSCDGSAKPTDTDPANPPPLVCCPTTSSQNKL